MFKVLWQINFECKQANDSVFRRYQQMEAIISQVITLIFHKKMPSN